jgi:hypothetical protein
MRCLSTTPSKLALIKQNTKRIKRAAEATHRVATPSKPPAPSPPTPGGLGVAAGGALRGAGERACERARRVPGAREHAAFVGPPAPVPRGGPARAHALRRRRRCTPIRGSGEERKQNAKTLATAGRGSTGLPN